MSDKHLLVFVIIILVIVALISTKVENAIAVSASVVAAFYLVKESEKHHPDDAHKDGYHKDGYFPQPGAPPPVPQEIPSVWQTSDHGESGYPRGGFNESSGYPGAIDPQSGGSGDLMYDTWPTFGHADRTVAETDYAPDGNPYDTNRLSAPYAAMPCIDDEAYGGALDADEANALQVRSRNDPERVIAGIMRRKEFLDPYLREEVEEAEDSRWWGRHEW